MNVAPGALFVTSARGQDGTTYTWDISQTRANALSTWGPASTPAPPLSIADAAKAGQAWLKQQNAEVRAFELSGLTLFRMQPYALTDRWYYRIEFDPIVAGRRLSGGGNFVAVVLFDGTVLEPRVEKR